MKMDHGWENLPQYQLAVENGTILDFAVVVFEDRNTPTKKDGKVVHSRRWGPRGFKVGMKNAQFWTPAVHEVRECCREIRLPGFKFGWVYYRHCCTATHVANLLGVDENELKARVFPPKKVTRKCGGCGKFAPAGDYLCKRCRGSESGG